MKYGMKRGRLLERNISAFQKMFCLFEILYFGMIQGKPGVVENMFDYQYHPLLYEFCISSHRWVLLPFLQWFRLPSSPLSLVPPSCMVVSNGKITNTLTSFFENLVNMSNIHPNSTQETSVMISDNIARDYLVS